MARTWWKRCATPTTYIRIQRKFGCIAKRGGGTDDDKKTFNKKIFSRQGNWGEKGGGNHKRKGSDKQNATNVFHIFAWHVVILVPGKMNKKKKYSKAITLFKCKWMACGNPKRRMEAWVGGVEGEKGEGGNFNQIQPAFPQINSVKIILFAKFIQNETSGHLSTIRDFFPQNGLILALHFLARMARSKKNSFDYLIILLFIYIYILLKIIGNFQFKSIFPERDFSENST